MNTVYRSVERQAHVLVPLATPDLVLVGAAGVLLGGLHVLAGVGAALLAVAILWVARRRSHGRHDWLALWARRWESPHYRMLDPDLAYRPYGPRASQQATRSTSPAKSAR